MADPKMKNRAFTLIELLVVMGVIALLAVMLVPVLAGTTQGTLRTQCLNNLRQLGIGSTVCANDNNGFFVEAKPQNNATNIPGTPPFVQIVISASYTNELSAAGIPLVSNAPSVWCCPDIPELPQPEFPGYPQWDIGYQYFGGITQWTPYGSTSGLIPGTHSPVKLTQSRPYWCLAADLVMKVDPVWGGDPNDFDPAVNTAFQYIPPHRQGTNAIPVGGNEVFVDGSASWCTVGTMHQFTCWTENYECWFYQSTADITSFGAEAYINTLRWTGN
jgi:prepilin-type N-terminal cleavage/methylation domain-containing protein